MPGKRKRPHGHAVGRPLCDCSHTEAEHGGVFQLFRTDLSIVTCGLPGDVVARLRSCLRCRDVCLVAPRPARRP